MAEEFRLYADRLEKSHLRQAVAAS
jgi:hypothetical protein